MANYAVPASSPNVKPIAPQVQAGNPINRGLVLAALSGGGEVANIAPGGPKISSTLPVLLKPTEIGRAADLRDDAGNVINGIFAPVAINPGAVTVSFWVQFGLISAWDRMVHITSATPATDELAIYRRSGQNNYKVDCYIGGTRFQTNGVGITQGEWYHFVIDARNTGASSAQVRVWENLTLRVTQTKTTGGGFTLGWTQAALGSTGVQGATYGRFTDWRVWNRTLTERERRLIYEQRRFGLIPELSVVPAAAGGTPQVRYGIDLLSGGVGGHQSQMLGGLLAA